MNLGQIASRAKQLIDRRGGTESLKGDAAELRKIASGQGSMSDKAKAAAEALKDPGADDTPPAAAQATPRPADDPRAAGRPNRRRGGRRRR